jgi:hypothetical protein
MCAETLRTSSSPLQPVPASPLIFGGIGEGGGHTNQPPCCCTSDHTGLSTPVHAPGVRQRPNRSLNPLRAAERKLFTVVVRCCCCARLKQDTILQGHAHITNASQVDDMER